VPNGRDGVYDAATGTFHVHFKVRNFTQGGFDVAKVSGKLPRPLKFRLTGIPRVYGCLGEPLCLMVGEKNYALDPDNRYGFSRQMEPLDEALYHTTRQGDAITIEFTEKGVALLKPGTRVFLRVDTGW
jgi:hypothetical protein